MAAEMIELAGNEARHRGVQGVSVEALTAALLKDGEMASLFAGGACGWAVRRGVSISSPARTGGGGGGGGGKMAVGAAAARSRAWR